MKRTMRNLIASGAVVAALAPTLTGCAAEEQTGYVDAGDKARVEKAVEEAGAFWEAQGIKGAEDLRTKIIEGSGTLVCGENTITSYTGDMRYCGGNTIGVSLAALNNRRASDGANADITIKGWAREAVGDYVQYKDPSLLELAPTDEDDRDFFAQLQRKCLAGIVTWDEDKDASLDKKETPLIRESFLLTGEYYDEVGHWMALAFELGYEAMTTDRNVCIDVRMPD